MSEKIEQVDSLVKRCFVITPIGAVGSLERQHADWVLNAAVKPVFESRGYEVYRSDTIADPAMINDAIFNHITDDEICIADLSFLNPNVFYELGVRHAILKPVIHIAHDSIRLPFDTAQHRAIFFSLSEFYSVENLKKQLLDQLVTIESDGFKVSNPLTHAKGRQELANSGDSKDKIIVELMSRVEQLEERSRSSSARSPKGVVDWLGGVSSELSVDGGISVLARRVMQAFAEVDSVDGVTVHELREHISEKFEDDLYVMSNVDKKMLYSRLKDLGLPERYLSIISSIVIF